MNMHIQVDTLINYTKSNELDSINIELIKQNESLLEIAENIKSASDTEKLFNLVTYDTVFTVLVTLGIFILGILVTRILKYFDRKSEHKSLRLYFKTYLDKITDKTAPRLAEMYKDFYQQNDIDSGITTTPPKILTGDFERIHNIQDKNLFSAINDKESLSRLLSNLDFLEMLLIEIDKYHIHALEESNYYRTPLQQMTNDYMDKLAEFVEHINQDDPVYPHRDEFKDLINESILKYHQEFAKTRQIRKFYREIIRPIQMVVINTNIFRIDSKALDIADLGKKISYQYNYLKTFTIDLKLSYHRFYHLVKKTQNDLINERSKITWR